jgi:hypothetical protein
MRFIYFSLATFAALAVASPAAKDSTSLSDGIMKARGLAEKAPLEKRQWEWLYDDEDYFDDFIGDFDTWISDNSAKAKAKRQTLTS